MMILILCYLSIKMSLLMFELEDNDDNWDVLVDELQQTSSYLTGDGESVSDRTKKFDDLVDKISAI